MNFPKLVEQELDIARRKHPQNIVSLHEGLAVILEEFEEFKAEVFLKKVCKENLLAELVSVAAMCQRMADDVVFDLFEGDMRLYEEYMAGESERAGKF